MTTPQGCGSIGETGCACRAGRLRSVYGTADVAGRGVAAAPGGLARSEAGELGAATAGAGLWGRWAGPGAPRIGAKRTGATARQSPRRVDKRADAPCTYNARPPDTRGSSITG